MRVGGYRVPKAVEKELARWLERIERMRMKPFDRSDRDILPRIAAEMTRELAEKVRREFGPDKPLTEYWEAAAKLLASGELELGSNGKLVWLRLTGHWTKGKES
jgi:hypothetical protein